jgi:hypothetical protein
MRILSSKALENGNQLIAIGIYLQILAASRNIISLHRSYHR